MAEETAAHHSFGIPVLSTSPENRSVPGWTSCTEMGIVMAVRDKINRLVIQKDTFWAYKYKVY